MAGNNLVVVVAVGQSHAFPICFDGQVMSLSRGARQIGRNEMEVTFIRIVTFLQTFFFVSHHHIRIHFCSLSLFSLQFCFTVTHVRARYVDLLFEKNLKSVKNDL
jgi:hypothetical protein